MTIAYIALSSSKVGTGTREDSVSSSLDASSGCFFHLWERQLVLLANAFPQYLHT